MNWRSRSMKQDGIGERERGERERERERERRGGEREELWRS